MPIRYLHQSAIEFEGFGDLTKKIGIDQQPEVIDPKTGKPFNLKDPDFPVVVGHKFKERFWSMFKTPTNMLRYLDEHYDYFNRTRFSSKLIKPELALLKNVGAERLKLRGLWEPGPRRLSVTPRLFNSPHEGFVNRVLVHEMCHQYVTDFKGGEREEEGHGPKWRATMLMAGLTPQQYDFEGNDRYMNKVERKAYERTPFAKGMRLLEENRTPVKMPYLGMRIMTVDSAGKLRQMRVTKPTKKPHIFEVEDLGNGIKHKLSVSLMFEPNDKD